MKDKIISKTIDFIKKHKECDYKTLKSIEYGLSGLYNTLIKTIVVIIISIILNTFVEFLLLWLFYCIIRRHSYGWHSSSSIVCWFVTLSIYIGGSILIKYLLINEYIYYILWGFCFISFILWSPADTPKRPLIHKEKRKVHKIKSCITCLMYLVGLILFNNRLIDNALILALIIQSLSINPLIYFITKTTFNNYKLYVKKV